MNFIECRLTREAGKLHARADALDFCIPEGRRANWVPMSGKSGSGIRPEHILDPLSFEHRGEGETFQASVWVVEPLGSEKFVHLRVGQRRWCEDGTPCAAENGGESSLCLPGWIARISLTKTRSL